MEQVRVVCISDTHLRRPRGLPAWCLRRLDGADLILHAGDIVAPSVLDELTRLAPLEAVRGNMDELALKERLPERQVIETAGVKIGLLHDPGPSLGRAARLIGLFPECEAIVYGHTHFPDLSRVGRRLILNPGSPTAPRATMGPTLIELVIAERVVEPVFVTP